MSTPLKIEIITITKTYNTYFNSICENYIRANKNLKINNVRPVEFLNFDYENRKIKFKKCENFATLRRWTNSIIIKQKFTTKKKIIHDVYKNIGHFIALYHKTSGSEKYTQFPLSENISFPNCHQSFLHGDLTDRNIIINDNNEVVILDWESSPIVDKFFNYGSSLWDVVWFSNTLLRPSPGTYFNAHQRIQIVMFFLSGYEKIYKLDLKTFFQYYNDNIKDLNKKIYKKKNILNKFLLNRHYKNWYVFEKKLLSNKI